MDPGSNRLTTSTAPSVSASYTYDGAGQITGDGSRAYTWTKAGYMATALSPQGSASYSYNAFGQRVKKVVGSGARHYLYAEDGVSLLGEYGQASVGASIASLYEVVYLEGIPVMVLAGGQTYFIQSDHLNSPRTVKNSAGATVWRWESDAFGNGAANQNPGGVALFEFNLRFPGQQFDSESGLYYNNARYYDPVTGRYVSSDPIGLAGGINSFGYANGDPVHQTDKSGLSPEDVRRLLVGGLALEQSMIKTGAHAPAGVSSFWWNAKGNLASFFGLSTKVFNCVDQAGEVNSALVPLVQKQGGPWMTGGPSIG